MEHERGQAGVETLIALPVLLLVALVGAQAVVWALGALLAGSAASAGARALARGEPAVAGRAGGAARPAAAAHARRRGSGVSCASSFGFRRSCPALPTFEVSARARP